MYRSDGSKFAGTTLFLSEYSYKYDRRGNFILISDRWGFGEASLSVDRRLLSAAASATVPAARCTLDRRGNYNCTEGENVLVDVAWSGHGDLVRSNGHWHSVSNGFTYNSHSSGTYRAASASGAINTNSLGMPWTDQSSIPKGAMSMSRVAVKPRKKDAATPTPKKSEQKLHREAEAFGGEAAQNSAVINPYALAELVAGRKIAWSEIPDAPRELEDILQTPYEELFDPKYEGPLYMGLRLNSKLQLEPVRSPVLDVELRLDVNDLEHPLELEFLSVRKLADLGPPFNVDDIGGIEVRRAELVGQRYLELTLQLPANPRIGPRPMEPGATLGASLMRRPISSTRSRARWLTAITSRPCPL